MLTLAIPVIIQNFIGSFLNMVDTVMVGRLGETAIAAVGIANQYFFIFMMFLIGLSAGCAVFIAQFWGRKDLKNIRRILGVGLVSALLVSALFVMVGVLFPRRIITLFNNDPQVIAEGSRYLQIVLCSYLFTGIAFVYVHALRAIGNTLLPMAVSTVALVCNVFFNYMLIFGKFGAPALGVAGAAIATVIARVVETGVLVAVIYWRRGVLAASFGELRAFDRRFVRKAYQTIIPVILNDICWGLASLIYAVVYGRMGTQAVATIQIVNTITNLFMVVIFGLSSAAAVMIGNSIGAGQVKRARIYAKRFSVLAVVLGVVLGLMLAVASPYMLNAFNVSAQVRKSTQTIIYIVAVIFFIRVFNIIAIVGVLRGGGDARSAFLLEGFTMWLIGVPLTIVGAFVLRLPVHLVYGLGLCEELTKGLLCLWRLRSGRWIHNVTHRFTGG
ncbi:MAG: MATE family efflux transporter [Firmicutes bacterium]|nr:MATE family efflux transporter [Bacillota bacterium]